MTLKKPQLIGISGRNMPDFNKLSTIVDEVMWISVDNLINKHLGDFVVDTPWIKSGTYTQVIHILQSGLKACNRWLQKIKLDRLSTYPHSLLLLLIIKLNK